MSYLSQQRYLIHSHLRAVALFLGVACFCCTLCAQTSASKSSGSDESWTTSHDERTDIDSIHTVESHTKSGNRTIDRRTTERRGPDGNVSLYQEVETESVQVNPSTTRTITRTFDRDGNGGKTLVQITEDETQILPGGSKSTRSSTHLDSSGNVQLAQREFSETKKLSPNLEVTKTTVLQPGVNGGFTPITQIEERKQRSGVNTEFQKTTRILDGGGNWQVGEIRKGTIKEDGKNRTTDEHVSRNDPSGTFGEVGRAVTKESESPSGEKRSTVETYSVDVPGATRDGSLHLVQREIKTQGASSGNRQTSVQQLEQLDPGEPSSGMRVITITKEDVRLGASGNQATRTIQVRNGSGNYDVVSVDTSKSDKTHAIQVQIAPDKPK